MRTTALFFLFAISLTSTAFAQVHIDFDRIATLDSRAVIGRRYTINTAALSRYAGERITIDGFPITYTERASVVLAPTASPLDKRTMVAGEPVATIGTPSVWRGCIAHEPASRVIIAITNGFFFASLESKGASPFVICPDRRDPRSLLFVSQTDLLALDTVRPMLCLNEDMQQLEHPGILSRSDLLREMRPSTTHNLLQAEIAVEADSCFFVAAGGSTELVEAYINALFAMSSAIYEDEAQITFHIPWLKLWSSGDPYNVKGDAYALPDTVRSYWKTHYTDVPRDIAHVMTSIGYGGGGFGWFGMCSTDYGYSVSSPRTHEPFPTFAFTYDAYIVSHEIGHNFGLPHSHACYWNPPLDTCYTNDDAALKLSDACYGLPITPRKNPGTIMSYCANANYQLSGKNYSEYKLEMTFSPRVADTLRRNAESYTCITEPAGPAIRLLSPRGGTTLPGDTSITVSWTSAHVSLVNLGYSSDGGSQWTPIAQNVSAMEGAVTWRVPNTGTSNGMVFITDASNASSSDTSLLPITVAARASVAEAPASQQITITSETISFPTTLTRSNFEIYDLLGSRVMSGEVDRDVLLHGLGRGVYILRILHDQHVESYRFIH